MKRGIDISRYQGNLDFDYIKENFDFVIIRCAYGSADSVILWHRHI